MSHSKESPGPAHSTALSCHQEQWVHTSQGSRISKGLGREMAWTSNSLLSCGEANRLFQKCKDTESLPSANLLGKSFHMVHSSYEKWLQTDSRGVVAWGRGKRGMWSKGFTDRHKSFLGVWAKCLKLVVTIEGPCRYSEGYSSTDFWMPKNIRLFN